MSTASMLCRALVAATMLVWLGGCFGGGGGGSGSTASTTIRNSFYVKVPNAPSVEVTEKSPKNGQTTTFGPLEDGTFYADGHESVSMSVDGKPVQVTDTTEFSECWDCSDYDGLTMYEKRTIKQDGRTFTSGNYDGLKTGMATVNDRFLGLRTSTGQWREELEHAYYGEYVSATAERPVTATPDGDPDVGVAETASITMGHFFGGDTTSSGDMDTLKNSSVTATYRGEFFGFALVNGGDPRETGGADIAGDVALTADFGAAAVSGNVYNMESYCEECDAGYGLALQGDISGASYSGTVQYTASSTAPGAAATAGSPTGELIGGFYGPDASETAGAIRIGGPAPASATGIGPPGTAADMYLGGSFGAVETHSSTPAP